MLPELAAGIGRSGQVTGLGYTVFTWRSANLAEISAWPSGEFAMILHLIASAALPLSAVSADSPLLTQATTTISDQAQMAIAEGEGVQCMAVGSIDQPQTACLTEAEWQGIAHRLEMQERFAERRENILHTLNFLNR
jgi:hypothetical protein